MQEDACALIAEFENRNAIAEGERCTEYSEVFGMYVFKLDVPMAQINEQYARAKSMLEGKVLADGKKLVAVFEKVLSANIRDTAKFGLNQEEEMLRLFWETESQEKRLGLKVGEECFMLLRKGAGEPVEMITLPVGKCEERYLVRLDEVRNRWLKRLTVWERKRQEEQLKEMAEASGSSLEQRQASFPFAREIRKRMKRTEHLFQEERMEGYDFREVDLQDAIFINCKLANSNFSGVNLENAFFFQCDLRGCIWYGAMLNNCIAYTGGESLLLSEKSRVVISGRNTGET